MKSSICDDKLEIMKNILGSAGKFVLDYVTRRLNALSAGSEKPVGGLNLR